MSRPYLTYSELRNKLEKGLIKALYLFQGEEEFLMEEAIDLLKEKVLGFPVSNFNFEKFYAKETKAAEIISSAETIPFLSSRRLLLVRDADLFPAAELDALAGYAIKPSPATCLILVARKIESKGKSLLEALKANGEIVQFWKLFENEVSKWIQQRARRYDLSISLEATLYLYEKVGNDLRQLDQELIKIQAFLDKEREISLGVLKDLTYSMRQYSVFDLVEYLVQRKLDKTLEILNALLREGEEPLKILALITRQIRLLWQAKLYALERKSLVGLEKELGIPTKYLKSLQEQEKNFSISQLKKATKKLTEIDLALKSSAHTPRILLESLIIDLIV